MITANPIWFVRHSQEPEGTVTIAGPGGDDDRERGCAYIDDGDAICGAPCRKGSSYCAVHHALCHLAGGSAAERRRLREAEALARAVGGRRGAITRMPPERFLRRLEQAARLFLRSPGSRYVRKGDQQ